MENPKLHSRPASKSLYETIIAETTNPDGHKWITGRLILTEEDFGFALWIGRCLETAQVWEESDWEYTLTRIWPKYNRSSVIREAVLIGEKLKDGAA